jgi:putative serine protease PepD
MAISSKVAAMAAVAVVAAAAGLAGQVESNLRDARAANQGQALQLNLQATEVRALKETVAELQAVRPTTPDWIAVAQRVEPSVVTIETKFGLASGWVGASDAAGSSLVTNYHVVAGAWEAGSATVTVKQFDNSFPGTIVKVDPTDDLAVVSIRERLPALASAPDRPKLAQPVMALGSPQGFDGSVATGIVSGYRSIAGTDFIQFSAPISPGNSGGPLVDGSGRVVGVAAAKWVDTGAEALGFAIPVQTVCSVLINCRVAG